MIDSSSAFTSDTFSFLRELSAGKDKTWFDSNRDTYEAALVEPFRVLVDVVGEQLTKLDPSFETTPQFNKTLTRINRDMRFAKGGSPYKDHMLALFYRRGRKKLDPQLFVGLQPHEAWVGLYVSAGLLADDAPIRRVVASGGRSLRAAARTAGIGIKGGNILATCKRYGEIDTVLLGEDPFDFLRGPHLVAMRRVAASKVIEFGETFATDCAVRLKALFPLWRVYAG